MKAPAAPVVLLHPHRGVWAWGEKVRTRWLAHTSTPPKNRDTLCSHLGLTMSDLLVLCVVCLFKTQCVKHCASLWSTYGEPSGWCDPQWSRTRQEHCERYKCRVQYLQLAYSLITLRHFWTGPEKMEAQAFPYIVLEWKLSLTGSSRSESK